MGRSVAYPGLTRGKEVDHAYLTLAEDQTTSWLVSLRKTGAEAMGECAGVVRAWRWS